MTKLQNSSGVAMTITAGGHPQHRASASAWRPHTPNDQQKYL
jgi:hypothetical protein